MLKPDAKLCSLILDSIEDLIVFHDENQNVIWMNKAACKYANKAASSNGQLHCFNVLFGFDAPCPNCPSPIASATQRAHRAEIQSPDGSWWEVAATPLELTMANGDCIQGVLNVSRRKTQGNTIGLTDSSSETFYRAVVEDQTEFICRFTPEGRLTFANSAICRLYNIDQACAIGSCLEDFLSPDELRRFLIRLERITPRRPIQSFRVHSVTPQGRDYWGDWTIRAIYNSEGFLVEYQAVGRDVTAEQIARIQLAESQANLEEAQAIAHIGSWRWDMSTNEVYWSDEVWRIFGLPPQKGPHKRGDLRHMVHPDDLPAMRQAIDDALENGKPYDFQYRVKRSDNTERVIHSKGVVRRDPSGKPVRFSGVLHDITELYTAQTALEKSESRLKAIINSIPDLMFRLDHKGRYIEYFARREELLAAPPSQLIGSTFEESLPPEVSKKAYAALAEALESGQLSSFEYELDLPVGKYWFEARMMKCDENEVLAIVRDVTPQIVANQKLKSNEEYYRFLFDQLLDPVYVHRCLLDPGLESYFIEANQAATEMLGYTLEEFRQLKPEEFDAGPVDNAAEIEEKLAKESSVVFERLHRAKSGELIPVEIHAQTLQHQGEEMYVSVIRDLRPRQQAEKALREREHRFRRMFEHHSLPMLLLDPDTGRILSANTSAQRFYGYPLEQITKMNIADINTLSKAEIAHARESVANETCSHFIFPHRLANGEVRTVEVNSSPIVVEDQMVLFSIISDITERERTLELLKASELKFQLLLDIAPIGIGLAQNQTFKWFNQAMLDMLGYTHEELIGINLRFLYCCDEDYEQIGKYYSIVVESKSHASQETRWVRKDGRILNVVLTGTSVPMESEGSSILFTITDITDQKLSEAEREQLIANLKQSLAEIQTLSGLLPICAQCKKVRDDSGYWQQIEGYIQKHSAAQFSHSICPDCVKKLYPDYKDESSTEAE